MNTESCARGLSGKHLIGRSGKPEHIFDCVADESMCKGMPIVKTLLDVLRLASTLLPQGWGIGRRAPNGLATDLNLVDGFCET